MMFQTAAPDLSTKRLRLLSTTREGAVYTMQSLRPWTGQRVNQIEDCFHELKANDNRLEATLSELKARISA
jgi:hypothetical protein